MVTEFNGPAQELIRGVLADHPQWRGYAQAYGPTDDADAEEGSVRFVVPSPCDPTHRLELALRGSTIEVAYDCGMAGIRAEQQFIPSATATPGDLVTAVRQFVRDLCSGEVVVVRERLGVVARSIRRDGAEELAWFRSREEAEALKPGRYSAIHSWSATRDNADGPA